MDAMANGTLLHPGWMRISEMIYQLLYATLPNLAAGAKQA